MQNTFYHRNNILNDNYDVKSLRKVRSQSEAGQDSNNLIYSLVWGQNNSTMHKEKNIVAHTAYFPNSNQPAGDQSFYEEKFVNQVFLILVHIRNKL